MQNLRFSFFSSFVFFFSGQNHDLIEMLFFILRMLEVTEKKNKT